MHPNGTIIMLLAETSACHFANKVGDYCLVDASRGDDNRVGDVEGARRHRHIDRAHRAGRGGSDGARSVCAGLRDGHSDDQTVASKVLVGGERDRLRRTIIIPW